jgi:hypothetical protein
MADEVCTSASLDTFCCQIMLCFDTDISYTCGSELSL